MLGCASPPGQLDLADKPLGTEGSRDVGLQNLDCDLAMMLEILGQVDDRHPTVAEHTLDCVAVTEGTPHECPCRNKWPSRLYYLLTWYQPPNRQRDIDTCTTEARTTAHLLGTRATRREAGRVAN